MNELELAECGVNTSLVHEDFMVGTKDLNITGICEDGKETPVFIHGNWAFQLNNIFRQGFLPLVIS